MSGVAPHRASPEADSAGLAEAVRLCRRSEEFLAELRRLYGEADARAERSGARCMGGGGCCKFDLFGHRLYLAAGELALLTLEPPKADPSPKCDPAPKAGPPQRAGFVGARDKTGRRKVAKERRCPYQAGGRCLAHVRRPLGCRVYFCRPGDPDEPNRAYEEFHARLKVLHRRYGLPYLYVELTDALGRVLPESQARCNGE